MPFYSVDSTSWLSGSRFGTTYEFRNGQLKTHQDKAIRKKLKRQCEELGVNHALLLADDGKTVNEWNMLQWKMYADWLTQSPMKKNQEYWHDRVYGGEIKKKVTIDPVTYEKEVIILNGAGEVYNPDDYKTPDEEVDVLVDESVEVVDDEVVETEVAVVETNAPLTKTGQAKSLMEKGMFMRCDSCTLGDRCPLYKEESICRVPFKEVGGTSDFPSVLQYLFTLQQKRITLGALQEAEDGGLLDDKLSKEIDRMMRMMQQFKELSDTRDEVTIKAKGTGILAQIFGAKSE